MKVAKFVNFTSHEFVVYWNGKAKKFAPGQSRYMEDGIVQHHAKHLTNKVLLEKGKEMMTSPKDPKQVPDFMELFNQAYIPQDDSEDDTGNDDETNTQVANLNRQAAKTKTAFDHLPPQVVSVPDDGADDEFENSTS